MIGLGCMRLSTVLPRDEGRAIAVIHAALDAGATLLDTADSYATDEVDTGHNERLIARALASWTGDRSIIDVATKGGLRRPGGRWVPDGRATHLRSACEASRRALDVETIDLYQLHAIDPRTAIETSVRALAAMQRDGWIRRLGLCNVTIDQIEAARRIAEISSVQVSISPLDDSNLRNGVAEYCRDAGIRVLAYRPLGGDRRSRLARDPVLCELAGEHGVTPYEIALAWLLDLDRHVVPIPGATSVPSAQSLRRTLAVALTEADRARLDVHFPAGRLLRVPRATRRPVIENDGDVVVVMGMPAAGKSAVAADLVAAGYTRLNRDERGGRLTDLVRVLDEGLAAGHRRWVLDNTYASRAARNEVIECAWRHGVHARCIHLDTSIADAQINAVLRLLDAYGTLPSPEELRAHSVHDDRCFGPDAQFRYERQLERPATGEGWSSIDVRRFVRRPSAGSRGSGIIIEFDGALCTSRSDARTVLDPGDVMIPAGRREALARCLEKGSKLLAMAWRPQVTSGETTASAVQACFERARTLLDLEIEFAVCIHPAGPPVCWCRKPLPGLVLHFVHRHRLALARCTIVGAAAADRTLAQRLGMECVAPAAFFAARRDPLS